MLKIIIFGGILCFSLYQTIYKFNLSTLKITFQPLISSIGLLFLFSFQLLFKIKVSLSLLLLCQQLVSDIIHYFIDYITKTISSNDNYIYDSLATTTIAWNILLANYLFKIQSEKRSTREMTRCWTIIVFTYFFYYFSGSLFPGKGISDWIRTDAQNNLILSILLVFCCEQSKRINNLFEGHREAIYDLTLSLLGYYALFQLYFEQEYYIQSAIFNFLGLSLYSLAQMETKINQFKKLKIGDEIDLEEETVCTICQESITHATQLTCGHAFHKLCLMDWCEKSIECPLCRKPIETTDRPIQINTIGIPENLKNKNEKKSEFEEEDTEIDNWKINETTE